MVSNVYHRPFIFEVTQNRYSPSEAKSYATVINAARDQPQVVAELFQKMPSRFLASKLWGRVAQCRGLEGNVYSYTSTFL